MMPTDLASWVRWLTFLPIVLASVVGLALTLWKLVQLRQPNLPPLHVSIGLREFLEAGELEKAADLTSTDDARGAPIAAAAVAMVGRSRIAVSEQVGFLGRQIARELEFGLGGLALVATLGPLLGLFGTVVGIVLVFERLSALEGLASPQQLAGGIGTALYTTVAGLIVGMLALISHRYLSARVDHAVAELETMSYELVTLVTGDSSGVPPSDADRVS
jgi:biopolymer transport protein ExbB